jgi:hypothetical protein
MATCPQSGDHAPVKTDPTGHFECNHCGKLLVATYRRHMVPKHQAPDACQCMQEPDGQGGEHVAVHSSD